MFSIVFFRFATVALWRRVQLVQVWPGIRSKNTLPKWDAKNRTTFPYIFISSIDTNFIITILYLPFIQTVIQVSSFLYSSTQRTNNFDLPRLSHNSPLVLCFLFLFFPPVPSTLSSPPTSLLPQTTINYKITWVAFLQNYSTAGEKKKKEFLW